MIVKPIVCALVAGTLSLFGAGIAYAGEHETHATEAIKHAEVAANEGQKGNAAAVAEHAQEALKHAGMAQKVVALSPAARGQGHRARSSDDPAGFVHHETQCHGRDVPRLVA
jgi:hypothetical protein